jgi:hypothetical protein
MTPPISGANISRPAWNLDTGMRQVHEASSVAIASRLDFFS